MNIGVTSPRLLIRKSLCALLSGISGFRVLFDTDGVLTNLELVRKLRPDILLIDAIDPALNFNTLAQVRTLFPETKALMLSDHADEDYQLEALRQGAYGFVSQDCDPGTLEKALKQVERGEIWISHGMATHIIGRFVKGQDAQNGDSRGLTKREQEVLALVADGCSNKEIANTLCVAENTVRVHLTSLYKKIHVGSRLEAALHYFERAKHNGHLPVVPLPGGPPTPSKAAAPSGGPGTLASNG